MDAIAALLLAAYLYSVHDNSRTRDLYSAVKVDALPFALWFAAVGALIWAIGKTPKPLDSWITTLLVVSGALAVGPQVISGVDTILDMEK